MAAELTRWGSFSALPGPLAAMRGLLVRDEGEGVEGKGMVSDGGRSGDEKGRARSSEQGRRLSNAATGKPLLTASRPYFIYKSELR